VCFLTHLIIVDEQQNPKTAAEKKRSKFLSLAVMVGDVLNFFEYFLVWGGDGVVLGEFANCEKFRFVRRRSCVCVCVFFSCFWVDGEEV
jgi:hypothetical protein